MKITAKGPQGQRAPEKVSPSPNPAAIARTIGAPKQGKVAAAAPRTKGGMDGATIASPSKVRIRARPKANGKSATTTSALTGRRTTITTTKTAGANGAPVPGPLPGLPQAPCSEVPTKAPTSKHSPKTPKERVIVISSRSLFVTPVHVHWDVAVIARPARPPSSPGLYVETVPWKTLLCPCIGNDQQLCDKPLGHSQNCSCCQEHRKCWSSKQAQDSWTSLPTPTKCLVLQLDRRQTSRP